VRAAWLVAFAPHVAGAAGPVRHTISHPTVGRKLATDGSATPPPELDLPADAAGPRPAPVLRARGIVAVYRDLVADETHTRQVTDDVTEALQRGRHCLVLTKRVAHLDQFADALRERGKDR
jgi:hypothetical protein